MSKKNIIIEEPRVLVESVSEVVEAVKSPTIRIRSRQTGFTVDLPRHDWDAYNDDQRAAYEVLD